MILRDLLGTDLPIIQAPMAGVQGSALAVAVSNAGGLGSLPCAVLDPATLHDSIRGVHGGGGISGASGRNAARGVMKGGTH